MANTQLTQEQQAFYDHLQSSGGLTATELDQDMLAQLALIGAVEVDEATGVARVVADESAAQPDPADDISGASQKAAIREKRFADDDTSDEDELEYA